ncbi:hypothetical protein TGAM01_v203032 [Trichoderma gamsii]|uniref:Uncharacterized protein n=1 Tax=Trichoderma gamsii TaxID=398673 RepID=A0A2P4ZUC3_9HYPO|nr:hypothetical protein TGAM01_v203032 [Trichoderma gamsii]PON27895.1 hypothetical protein TGAM01_v203032 [Trichoderma gamsii]
MVPFSMVEPVASEQDRTLQGPQGARAGALVSCFWETDIRDSAANTDGRSGNVQVPT